MSHAISVPSAKAIPQTEPSRLRTRVVLFWVCTVMPMFSTDRRRIAPAASSSCAFIRVGVACTTSTVKPRFCRPRAASRPSSPPPMTTAFVFPAA